MGPPGVTSLFAHAQADASEDIDPEVPGAAGTAEASAANPEEPTETSTEIKTVKARLAVLVAKKAVLAQKAAQLAELQAAIGDKAVPTMVPPTTGPIVIDDYKCPSTSG